MSRKKNVTRAVLWGIIYRFIVTILPFVTRTLLIRQLGMTYVGINGLFASVVGILSIAEMGFGSAMISKMYEPIAKKNDEKVCALLSLYKKVYYAIGFLVIIFGVVLLPFLKVIIREELPSDVNVYIIFLINLLNTVIGYFSVSYKQSIIYASQRVDLSNVILLVSAVFQYCSQCIVLLLFQNYYCYIVILPLGSIVNLLLINVILRNKYPQYVAKGVIAKDEQKGIIDSVKALFISRVGGMIRGSADNIVIELFFGIAMVGLYDNYFYIISALMAIFSIVMNAFIPSVGNLLVEESMEMRRKIFFILNHLYGLLASFCSIMFLCICQPFMKLWVGENNILGMEIVVLLAVYLYVHKFCDMLAVFQDASGSWQYTKWVPMIAAIVNLILNITLVVFIGLPGVIISTIVSVLFIYDLGYSIPLFRVLFGDKNGGLKYYMRQMIYLLLTVITGALFLAITSQIEFESILLTIVARGIVVGVFGTITLCVVYAPMDKSKEAYKYIIQRIRKRS